MISVLTMIVFTAWLATAIVGRSLVQAKRTGDAGWQTSGGLQRWTRIMMAVGAVGGGVAAPAADLAGLPRLPVLDLQWLRVTGLVMAAAATVASTLAQRAMGTAWRLGVHDLQPATLVTGGPFALIRNPVFAATQLFALGLLLAVPNLISLLGFATAVAGIQLQVRLVEEPSLLHTHGTAYQQYAATVGRYLPGVGRMTPR